MKDSVRLFHTLAALMVLLSAACGVKGGPLPPLDDPIATIGSKPSASPRPSPTASPWVNQ